jgi:urease accessory protein
VCRTSTELAVERGAITALRPGPRLALRVLERRGSVTRAALVPLQAGPLAGDHDIVRLCVGAGETLVLEPIAATLALPGGERTRLELHAEVAGRLVLDEAPLIVSEGADVLRTTRIALARGAVAAWRDTVVLGRAGEGAGRLEATARVTLDGVPLLHETLRIDPRADDAYVALAPGHRVVGTVALLGVPGTLAGAGSLWRASGTSAAQVEAHLYDAWQAATTNCQT